MITMKKSVTIFLLSITAVFLFIGCSSKTAKDETFIGDSLEQTQKVDIIPSDGTDTITLSDDNDIKEFVLALKIDKWHLENIPSDADEKYIYKIYQQETKKLWGGINKNRDLNEVATLTAYKDLPYIDFNIKGFSLSFKVPENVAEYLNTVP